MPGRRICSAAYVAASLISHERRMHSCSSRVLMTRASVSSGARVDELGRREERGEVEPHRRGVVVDRDALRRAAGELAHDRGQRRRRRLRSPRRARRARDRRRGRAERRRRYDVKRCGWSSPATTTHDDAVVVATAVVGQHVARAARVHHVAGAEEQQRVDRLRRASRACSLANRSRRMRAGRASSLVAAA